MDHYVDFSMGEVIKVHSDRLKDCSQIANSNVKKKRYRICLHSSAEEKFQEMIICRMKGDYSRPSKHRNCPETHTILEGRMAVVLFDDDGKISDCFVLDNKTGYLSCRINAEIYHMLVPLSDSAITFESKIGPFSPEMNIFPKWAPPEEDKIEGEKYQTKIEGLIKKYLDI